VSSVEKRQDWRDRSFEREVNELNLASTRQILYSNTSEEDGGFEN
jgi:hypothetical protein